jgi:BlaI family penicillinase repressor
MADATAISEAEWQVMNVVWDSQPVDSQQVIDQLAAASNWSSATIKTMLHRLVKKQVLAFEQTGKRYLYRAAVGRNECVRQASRSFLERVFCGAAAPALMHLVQTSSLTADEVAELRRLLDRKESES